jgi:hypothetical protein
MRNKIEKFKEKPKKRNHGSYYQKNIHMRLALNEQGKSKSQLKNN